MPCDAIGQVHARAAPGARIVSLVPSVTELLFALGLGAQVVGRTGFCVHPRAALRAVPKLGGTKDVDFDGIRRLAPSHVIVNIDENTRAAYARLRELVPHVIVTHPLAPADNRALYRLLGAVFARETQAERLCAAFDAALARLGALAAQLPARRVIYLIWRAPWMTVARDTYISRMLALINWHTLPATATARYPELASTDFAHLAPELCLLSSEPYRFRTRHLAEVAALCPAASAVRLVDGELLSWYGSRAIAGLDYLASLAQQPLARSA